MGCLDERARKRVTRQLASALEPGETVVRFDTGDVPAGTVHLVVTDRRLFVVERGGRALPIRLDTIASVVASGSVIGLRANDDSQLYIDFSRTGGFREDFLSALGGRHVD